MVLLSATWLIADVATLLHCEKVPSYRSRGRTFPKNRLPPMHILFSCRSGPYAKFLHLGITPLFPPNTTAI